jgi:hypothetical protein
MEKVLEAMPCPPPCLSPCPDEECTACCPGSAVAAFEAVCYRWNPGKALPLTQKCQSDVVLDACDNSRIVLPCKKRFALIFEIHLERPSIEAISIKLQATNHKISISPQFFQTSPCCEIISLSGSSIITTFHCDQCNGISFYLLSADSINVKWAEIRISEM